MKIFLIDDHISFCEGLVAALGTIREDYRVEFESNAELIPESLLGRTDYDLFIMDLMMPGLGGIELIRYLNRNRNQTPIIVMSSVQDPAVVREVFQLGVIGYLPKSYSVYQIVDAIEDCRQGNVHIPAFLASGVSSGSDLPAPASGSVTTRPEISLTKRQIEIISLMDQGLSNQQIADKLFISRATVKSHVNQLYKAFNVNNRILCLRAAKELIQQSASLDPGEPKRSK